MGLWDKIAGAARWLMNGARNIVGKVTGAINTGKDVVGRVTSTPIIGDLVKTGWSMVPGSGLVDNIVNSASTVANTINKGLNVGEGLVDGVDSVLGKRSMAPDFSSVSKAARLNL